MLSGLTNRRRAARDARGGRRAARAGQLHREAGGHRAVPRTSSTACWTLREGAVDERAELEPRAARRTVRRDPLRGSSSSTAGAQHRGSQPRLRRRCSARARGQPCYKVLKGRTERLPDLPRGEDLRRRAPSRCWSRSADDRTAVRSTTWSSSRRSSGDGPEVDFVAAITTDLTATRRLQREYQTLFEKVPCYVAVINRDYRVVKANERFRRTFGAPTGEHCYRLFKQRGEPCPDCPVSQTFLDGESHTVRQLGVDQDGSTTHYVAFTAPLMPGRGRGDPRHPHVPGHDRRARSGIAADPGQRHAPRAGRELARRHAAARRERAHPARQPRGRGTVGLRPGRPDRPQGAGADDPAPLRKVVKGKADRRLLHEADGDHEARRARSRCAPRRSTAATSDGEHMGSAVMAHDLTRDEEAGAGEARGRAARRGGADGGRPGPRHQEHPHRSRGRHVRHLLGAEEERRQARPPGLGDARAQHGPHLRAGQEPAGLLPRRPVRPAS